MNFPEDPISPLLEAAISMREMFLNFIEGGFSEDQALKLVIEMVIRQPERVEDNE